jgi:membrane-associated phospholipid phosphatase
MGFGLFLCCLIPLPAPAAQAPDDFYDDHIPLRPDADSIGKGLQAVLDDAKALVTAPLSMDRHDALMTGGALALVGASLAVDREARALARRNQTASGQDLAAGFDKLGSVTTLVGLNAGLIAAGVAWESYGGSSSLKQTGLVSLEAELFAVGVSFAIKEVTGRARPSEQEGATRFRPFGGDRSFPSSHAAGSFAVAAVIADRSDPWVGALAYTVATAVSASRVYGDLHFTSDVVAGGLLGWGIGTFLSRQHPTNPLSWQVRPLAMEGGVNGLTVGKRF